MVHASVGQVERAGIVVVAPDGAAGRAAVIDGATPRERLAAHASLALVGADARGLRVRFAACPAKVPRCAAQHVTRSLTVEAADASSDAPALLPAFLGSLVAREVAGRLQAKGERIGWQVLPYGQRETGGAVASVSRPELQQAAQLIAGRAATAGWVLAPVRLYTLAGGAMVVIVRFDDHTLFSNGNSAFRSTLFGQDESPPIAQTMLLIEGPGDVVEGGGAPDVGASYGANGTHPDLTVPAWLEQAPTQLLVTIQRVITAGESPVRAALRRRRARTVPGCLRRALPSAGGALLARPERQLLHRRRDRPVAGHRDGRRNGDRSELQQLLRGRHRGVGEAAGGSAVAAHPGDLSCFRDLLEVEHSFRRVRRVIPVGGSTCAAWAGSIPVVLGHGFHPSRDGSGAFYCASTWLRIPRANTSRLWSLIGGLRVFASFVVAEARHVRSPLNVPGSARRIRAPGACFARVLRFTAGLALRPRGRGRAGSPGGPGAAASLPLAPGRAPRGPASRAEPRRARRAAPCGSRS